MSKFNLINPTHTSKIYKISACVTSLLLIYYLYLALVAVSFYTSGWITIGGIFLFLLLTFFLARKNKAEILKYKLRLFTWGFLIILFLCFNLIFFTNQIEAPVSKNLAILFLPGIFFLGVLIKSVLVLVKNKENPKVLFLKKYIWFYSILFVLSLIFSVLIIIAYSSLRVGAL